MNSFRAAALWLICLAAQPTVAGERPAIRGRVIDEQGRPVAGVDVDFFWTANGLRYDKDGNFVPLRDDPESVREFWSHKGEMAPRTTGGGRGDQRSDKDGRFLIARHETSSHTLVAMDGSRERGGRCDIPEGYAGSELEIKLGLLVQVSGKFTSPTPGRALDWSYADVFVPEDPARPLDFTRLAGCETMDGQWSLKLPVGRYLLFANNSDPNWELRLVPSRELVLTADKLNVDLGTVPLTETQSVRFRERQAKKEGKLGDYKKLYGQAPPSWHVDEARGVDKNVQISHFKGKWVLLDFWGLSCTPCLAKTMPELFKFYEDHAADRDRFEILSICIDTEGELESLADLDKKLKPVVDHVWKGRTIPFPILLDKTFETWLNFGIPGLGCVLLVDPEGHLYEGELPTLAEKLKQLNSVKP